MRHRAVGLPLEALLKNKKRIGGPHPLWRHRPPVLNPRLKRTGPKRAGRLARTLGGKKNGAVMLYIIYTETNVLLSKRSYSSWREIQDQYEAYKASLGPWDEEKVINYLAEGYSELQPSAQEQVAAFLAGPEEVVALSFRNRC